MLKIKKKLLTSRYVLTIWSFHSRHVVIITPLVSKLSAAPRAKGKVSCKLISCFLERGFVKQSKLILRILVLLQDLRVLM